MSPKPRNAPHELDRLIAVLLGDETASTTHPRWLETPTGRRELAAHRATLAALESLYRHLEPTAMTRTVPTLFYCGFPSPIGRVLVAASDAGLVRVSFRRSERSFVAELQRLFGGHVVRSQARTAEVVQQLRAYFEGERRAFDVQVDLSRLTAFHRRVLLAAAEVPAGRVVSYGEIARRIGQPGSSRAVGQALGRNPVPIVIPCHRIVAAGGKLGGYGGGLPIKRKLLQLEGALAAAG